jgi:hypothetical protein
MHLLGGLGAIGGSGPEAALSSASASGRTPSIATTSEITDPSTCAFVITKHATSVPRGYDYYMRRWHHHSLRTFHYDGFCALCNGLRLRKGCGILHSWRCVFFTSCCIGFLAFPRQISRFPTQYEFCDQPSKITNLHVLLEDRLHSQAGPDNSHSRSAKYAGNVNKPDFCGCLLFNMGDHWLLGSNSHGGLWPPLFWRRSRFADISALLCRLRHEFFNGGG